MRKYTILLLVLIVFAGIFSSCKKTEVITPATSTTYVLNSGNWQYDQKSDLWYTYILDAAITSDVVNFGKVEVDQQASVASSSSGAIALPYTNYANGTSFSFYYNCSLGQVEIDYQAEVTTSLPANNPGNLTFRVVVIPGQ